MVQAIQLLSEDGVVVGVLFCPSCGMSSTPTVKRGRSQDGGASPSGINDNVDDVTDDKMDMLYTSSSKQGVSGQVAILPYQDCN